MTIINREPAKQARFLYQITWDLFTYLRFAAVVWLTNRRCGGCHWGREKTKTKRTKTKQNRTRRHIHTPYREKEKKRKRRKLAWQLIDPDYLQASLPACAEGCFWVAFCFSCACLLSFSIFLFFFLLFFCLFLWWLLFCFLFESLDPTNNNTKQTASTAAILLLLPCNIQQPVQHATLDYQWSNHIATRDDHTRTASQGNETWGGHYHSQDAKYHSPNQQIHHRHLSLSLSCSSLRLVCSLWVFFF